MQIREECREDGQNKDGHEGDGEHDGHQQKKRIEERAPQCLAHTVLLHEKRCRRSEHNIERAALLPRAYHADEDRGKDLLLCLHRPRKRHPLHGRMM